MITLTELFMAFAIIAALLYAGKVCLDHYRRQS